uniref:STAS domain-containing protein n=1 Tax=Plectus sambesii TaxID=2011161 RepID=A0A914VCT8_9BILA
MLHDLGKALPQSNIATVIVSICSIAFLVIGRDLINPWVKKRFPIPIPFELLLVVFGTAASFLINLHGNYHVAIVDYIPRGIPDPSLPRIDLVPILLSDSIGIAIVCYVASVSMGKLFAKRHRYRLDAGQELYALGLMECLSSFFPVYPAGTAISRSLVCEAAGTKTQLHILFSSLLLLCVILWVGPLLEALPMCILACIVVVALQGIFMQFKQLKPLWTLSKFDFLVWIVSFLATACFDVTQGLAISVAFVLLTVVFRCQWAKWQQLGQLANCGEFCDLSRYGSAEQLIGVRVLRFAAQLNFANVELFKQAVQTVIDDSIAAAKKKAGTSSGGIARLVVKHENGHGVDVKTANEQNIQLKPSAKIKWLIIDCSSFAYLDAMGVDALKESFTDLKKQGINVYFANVLDDVRDMLKNIGFYQHVSATNFFPSIKSAYEAIQGIRRST